MSTNSDSNDPKPLPKHADGVYINPSTGKKYFIPLENNPGVLNSLIHKLGLVNDANFFDVYSLDKDVLATIPRPCWALIFITPPVAHHAVRAADGHPADVPINEIKYRASGEGQPVEWFAQTIGNACGLMALIHSVATGEARQLVARDSILDQFLTEAKPLEPSQRAQLLYDSERFEEEHMNAARQGNSAPPPADERPSLHFMAFVKGNDGHLWELEGSTDGPIDRGLLDEKDDMLSETALDLGVKRFIKMGGNDLNFSIVALCKGELP